MRVLFLIFTLFFFSTTFAQNQDTKILIQDTVPPVPPVMCKTRAVGLVGALGNCDVERKTKLEGDGYFSSEGYFSIGFVYHESINNYLSIETDPSFAKYSIKRSYADDKTSIFHIQMITIPVQARLTFMRFFFINTGFFLDLDLGSVEYGQSGIGYILGGGVKIPLSKRASLYANPNFQQHGLWLFKGAENPLRLRNAGLKIGVCYHFLK